MIYISSKYKFELVQSYNMNLNGCEDLWLEVTVPTNQTSFIIGAVYRYPSSKIETFCEAFINTINLLSKKIFYVLGDINIDISAKARTPSSTHYIKKKKSNLHYTRGITLKRVTSSGAHLRGLAPGLHSSEETSQWWRAVGDTADLTGPGIEPQTSRTDSVRLATELTAGRPIT